MNCERRLSGVLWAACLWLVVGPWVTDGHVTAEFAEKYHLSAVPASAWLAAVAVGTYLVGSLLVVRTSPLAFLNRRFRPWCYSVVERLDDDRVPARRRFRAAWRLWQRFMWRNPADWLRRWSRRKLASHHSVNEWLYNQFEALAADGRVPVMRSFMGGCLAPNGFEAFYLTETLEHAGGFDPDRRRLAAECFVEEVKRELPAVETRIQMSYPEVYSEIDRLRSEAEMRLSIFWPIVVLVGILAVVWTPFVLVFLLVPPMLLRDAQERLRQVSEKTWSPVIAGEVTTPVLDAMQVAADQTPRDFSNRFGTDPPESESGLQVVS